MLSLRFRKNLRRFRKDSPIQKRSLAKVGNLAAYSFPDLLLWNGFRVRRRSIMAASQDNRRLSALQLLPSATAVLSVVVATIVLAGWSLNAPMLKTLMPGLGAMRGNTAIAFLMLGGALWILSQGRPTFGLRVIAHCLLILLCILAALALGESRFSLEPEP